jgi:hypothetical protein
MFGLTDHNVSVTNLNLRVEKHGDERKPACDIKIVADIPSERLNEISPGLAAHSAGKPSPMPLPRHERPRRQPGLFPSTRQWEF